jgi:hypothetical protein
MIMHGMPAPWWPASREHAACPWLCIHLGTCVLKMRDTIVPAMPDPGRTRHTRHHWTHKLVHCHLTFDSSEELCMLHAAHQSCLLLIRWLTGFVQTSFISDIAWLVSVIHDVLGIDA